MWTPKRFLLLAFGYGLFLSAYFGYTLGPLGGIDGLPPLPELFWPTEHVGEAAPLPPRRSNLDGKLKLAFGEGSPELMRPIRLELHSRDMALAADQFQIEPDGRICLTPLSVAIFNRGKNPGQPPDINTLRCQVAYLKFDRPVSTLNEIGSRKVVGAEIAGNIQVVNNRRTAVRDDDLCLFINQGPLYYEEATNRIWTHDAIHVLDHSSRPKPIEVRGKGMVVDLLVDAPPANGTSGSRGKERTAQISGVRRVTLQSNVDMHLYVDGRSGFPNGNRPTTPKPAAPPAPTPAAVAPATPPKSHIAIKTPGRFVYEIFKDHDTAQFEAPVVKSAGYPQDVTVTRDLEGSTKVDQLICKRLDLRLRRREETAARPNPSGASPEQNVEIDTARATGTEVTLYSDDQSFEAHGNDFLYEAKQQKTVLKGEPHMIAMRDGSTIRARELHVQEQKLPVVPGQPPRSFHQSVAIGPVSIEMVDNKSKAGSKPLHAACSEKLIVSKDGNYDLLILSGAARFTDEEHHQHLQGEVLKVWLHPDERDEAASQPNATPRDPGNPRQARRPHHLEAIENVVAVSPELNIHDTARLVVWFKDVPPETLLPPSQLVPPARENSAPDRTPPLTAPAPRSAAPAHETNKAATPAPMGPSAAATPRAPEPRSELGTPRSPREQRPIDLSAHSVEAWVLRAGTKNQLEKIWTQGKVEVRQDPAKPEEKGVDIRGETLEMTCRPEGNFLVVSGDLAQLRMDKIYILGPEVNIDQAANKAWVTGAGAMQLDSTTSFQGEKLDRSVPLTIHWNKSMLFNGKFAEFHGGIQAEQENARMAGQSLQVFFDRPISLKEGNKGPQPRVQNLVIDRDVRIEETAYAGNRLIKSHSINAPVVVVNSNEPDDVDPKQPDARPGSEVRASGPGTVRLFQEGGDDPLGPPNAQPRRRPAEANNRAEPAEPQPKLTYVAFLKSMYANSRSNTAIFLENVRVLHLPAQDPNMEVDIDSLLDKLPPDAMYLRCDRLDVFRKNEKNEKGRANQEMLAKGRCVIQARDFWGRAPTVSYNEAKEQVIFEGDAVNPAVLYKVAQRGGTPQVIKAKKIIYLRLTGETKVDEVQSIDAQDATNTGPAPLATPTTDSKQSDTRDNGRSRGRRGGR